MDEIPFRYTTYAEDAQWAQDALMRGYAIVYNHNARVYHYHLEDAEFSFKKGFTVHYYMYKFFSHEPEVPTDTLMDKLRLVNLLRKADTVGMSDKLKWWKYNNEIKKAYKLAAQEFYNALSKGEDYLDKRHAELCGKPPIPKKS